MQLGKKNLFCECEVWCTSKVKATTTRVKLMFFPCRTRFFFSWGVKKWIFFIVSEAFQTNLRNIFTEWLRGRQLYIFVNNCVCISAGLRNRVSLFNACKTKKRKKESRALAFSLFFVYLWPLLSIVLKSDHVAPLDSFFLPLSAHSKQNTNFTSRQRALAFDSYCKHHVHL